MMRSLAVFSLVIIGCTAREKPEIRALMSEPASGDGLGPGLVPAPVPPPAPDGVGSFRVFTCDVAHVSHDDPIVYPGTYGAAHQHQFIGNEHVDAKTDALGGTTTTCPGGVRNLSSYWTPTMLDGAGAVVEPSEIWIYYKGGYHSMPQSSVADLPSGLRLIAGPNLPVAGSARWLGCASGRAMTDCATGQTLEMRITFPQCWDGTNLDSHDHRSHVVGTVGGYCPSTNPVLIPQMTVAVFWHVNDAEGTAYWRLSSDHNGQTPGQSAHADYWEAWEPSVSAEFVEHCIRARRNCNNGNLGNGWALTEVQ